MKAPQQPQAAREAASRLLLHLIAGAYGSRFHGMAIFGSTAKGTATEVSDLDIILCASPLPNSRFRRVEEFDRLIEWPFREQWEGHAGGSPIDLSPIIRTPEELLDVTLDAVILQDKGDHIRKALNSMRERLERSGAKRITRGGQAWWDLHPGLASGQNYNL